jgi:glycine/D-amino acid oxidase-like deaminating enzyme
VTQIAVLGAGFQGTCVALELARRGVDVDLYDRNDACITQAGARNEGKIHLGFVYANDASFDTTRLLVQGALKFDAALRRWLECDIADVGVSTPHNYAVHRDSMLSPDAVLAHFARVRDFVRELATARRCSYLGQDARTIAFEPQELGTIYDPEAIAAVIRTDERSIHVSRLATRLRERVAAEPRITFYPGTHITGATRDNGSIKVSFTHTGTASSTYYRHAVNCLWDGKLSIDQQMQFLPPYRSLYRLKYGINVALKQPDRSVPSTTFVVGPFGDIVQFDDRHLYLSWYPVARIGVSGALTPPDWPRELEGDDARRMIDATLAAFARLLMPMRGFHRGLFEEAFVAGGIILAAGETDIDDPMSRLHTRNAVGVRSVDGYHSVDTGKYTLAPMYAMEIADRVCGTALNS